VEERLAARMAAVVNFVSKRAAAIGLGNDHHVLPTVRGLRGSDVLGDKPPLVEWAGNLTAMLEAGHEFLSQRWWGVVAESRVREQEGLSRVRDQVRFACQQRPHTGAWLVSVPCVATKTLFPTEHFRGPLKWWLGMPELQVQQHHVRAHGASGRAGGFGAAGGVCVPQGGGGPYSRRPGDVFFPRWDAEGLTVVDVTIWHPLAPSAPVESRAGVEQWRTRQAEDKRAKYEADRGRLGWKFVPFAVDTFGGLGKGGL